MHIAVMIESRMAPVRSPARAWDETELSAADTDPVVAPGVCHMPNSVDVHSKV